MFAIAMPQYAIAHVGVDLGGLAERSLGFEIIKGVKLRDSLIDKRLGLGLLAGDREVNLPHAGHQIGGMSWSVVKCLAMHRMAGGRNGRVGFGCRRGRLDRLVAASRVEETKTE